MKTYTIYLLRTYLHVQQYIPCEQREFTQIFFNPRTGGKVYVPLNKGKFTEEDLQGVFQNGGDLKAEEEAKFFTSFMEKTYPHLLATNTKNQTV